MTTKEEQKLKGIQRDVSLAIYDIALASVVRMSHTLIVDEG